MFLDTPVAIMVDGAQSGLENKSVYRKHHSSQKNNREGDGSVLVLSFILHSAHATIQKMILEIEIREKLGKITRPFQKRQLKINSPRSRLHHQESPSSKN
jgi:hypothetical protein